MFLSCSMVSSWVDSGSSLGMKSDLDESFTLLNHFMGGLDPGSGYATFARCFCLPPNRLPIWVQKLAEKGSKFGSNFEHMLLDFATHFGVIFEIVFGLKWGY